MMKHIVATPAPKLRRRYGSILGHIAAGVLILFALVHLFRIDTFLPELSYALPMSRDVVSFIACLIIAAEVFALPFLLGMSLSSLARFLSGFLAIIAPLSWLLIAIWNYGEQVSTAQLGEFYNLPSGWLLIGFNVLWLGLNYWALWALGFGQSKQLSKTR